MGESRQARVGRRLRHLEAAASDSRERERDLHGRGPEIVLLVERVVFDDPHPEARSGDVGMGRGREDAVRDVQMVSGVEQVESFRRWGLGLLFGEEGWAIGDVEFCGDWVLEMGGWRGWDWRECLQRLRV